MENSYLKVVNGSDYSLGQSRNSDLLKIIDEDVELESAHDFSSTETPLRKNAFDISDNEKISIISHHFEQILHVLGMDLQDESLRDTPKRVAKMYVKEVFRGLNPENKPVMKLFPNKYQYGQMLLEKNITIYSYCEHHLVPIVGKAHIAYIPENFVVGLSKLNRIAQYFAQRPQVQERLTIQIGNELVDSLKTRNVAVVIEADHMCVASRGVKDTYSSTITSFYSGSFKDDNVKKEFLSYVNSK